ncbi:MULTISPECIES: NUMOD1 domain-containing DNA-binding protein [Fructobacillus]|jgi:predicted transcriptional regulator|uniref:Nuclease-associated modular DNA-binding 1 domain-containing protein n=1 Tax=Fructobacillus tropaeoli TaxID=709323 RepID=A0ABM9N234_9LACO|nr:hypothetical protein R55203_MFJFHIJN_01531 [Fructobacillus sp. LMG 32999]CAK1254539.1 hypothetical protein R53137_KAKDMLNK_01575 [Fructobacillus tropaeoli]
MDNKKLDSLQSFDSLTALAKELKISRQTLYKRLNDNDMKGRLSFTKKELSLLKKRPIKSVKVDSQVDKEVDSEQDKLISVLRAELKAKNHTINQLNEQLINSQKLQLMSQQHTEQLTRELHELKKIERPKQGFWARLFGK